MKRTNFNILKGGCYEIAPDIIICYGGVARDGEAKLGIDVPPNVKVLRKELLNRPIPDHRAKKPNDDMLINRKKPKITLKRRKHYTRHSGPD